MQTRHFSYNLLRIIKEMPFVCVREQQIFINILVFTTIHTLLSLKHYAPDTRSSVNMTCIKILCMHLQALNV